jgi:hypothetical protein
LARSKNLVVSITADNRGLKRGLHEAEGDVGRLERVTRRSSGAIGLIAKVYNGNVGALKRMGIAIDPVTTAQDKLRESTKHATVEQTRAAKEADKTATAQKALGELQKRVGGQAAAYGKTASGAQDRFRVAVENLRERLGKALLPDLTKVTNKVATFVNQMSDGTGAGGRFADKLKNIADRIKPIVKFFTDHPRLVAGAVAAWATYRLAVAAATAVSRLKMLGMFAGLAPKAAVEGAVAGRAFGGAASTSAGTTFSRRAPGMFAAGRFAGAGRAIGALLGTAIMAEVASHFKGPAWAKILRGLLPFQPTPGAPKLGPLTKVKLPNGDTLFIPKGSTPPSPCIVPATRRARTAPWRTPRPRVARSRTPLRHSRTPTTSSRPSSSAPTRLTPRTSHTPGEAGTRAGSPAR